MTITWYGQSCFRIEGREGSLLIDPFSKEIGLKPPRIKDDLVLVTHDHRDHNNLDGVDTAETFVITNPGEYERKAIAVHGLVSYHDDTQGSERGLNTIYVIKVDDITVCHLGDLGQAELTKEQIEDIGNIDILMVPVGGVYTIDGSTAVKVINQIEPKVIIPMHYKVSGLTIDLAGPEKFLKEIGLTPEEVNPYKVNTKTLPVDEVKLITMPLS